MSLTYDIETYPTLDDHAIRELLTFRATQGWRLHTHTSRPQVERFIFVREGVTAPPPPPPKTTPKAASRRAR